MAKTSQADDDRKNVRTIIDALAKAHARKIYRTRNEARADVFVHREVLQCATRRQSTIGYLSPVEFERKVRLA
jgi:hypothetical protein